MNLSEAFLALAQLGNEWVLWLLVSLSVVSSGIVLERSWFYWRRPAGGEALIQQIVLLLRSGDLVKARATLVRQGAPECQMLAAGLMKLDDGLHAVEATIRSARMREQLRLEGNLGVLSAVVGVLPLVGAFGTILSVIGLCDGMAQTPPEAGEFATTLLGGVAQALVTTAVALLIAVPAGLAGRLFRRRLEGLLTQMDLLTQLVLAQIPDKRNQPEPAAEKQAAEKNAADKNADEAAKPAELKAA